MPVRGLAIIQFERSWPAYYNSTSDKRWIHVMDDDQKPHYDKNDTDPAHMEERLRELAYCMWEKDGRQEGKSELYWKRAKAQLDAEGQSAYPPSQSRGNRD
jgi:hypothetical protein